MAWRSLRPLPCSTRNIIAYSPVAGLRSAATRTALGSSSCTRPGGNATGYNFFSTEVTGKRFQLLQHLDHPNIDVLLQEMGGKAVAQRVRGHALADPGQMG
jgi:hypothetical protein